MKTRLLLWLLLGLALIAVPATQIFNRERILTDGVACRFRLAPIDPADPFRGRYMTLSYELNNHSYPAPADVPQPNEAPLYALLKLDADGYVSIVSLHAKAPAGLYLTLPAGNWHKDWGAKNSLRIRVPMERFYLNEEAAPGVEQRAQKTLSEARAAGKAVEVHALIRLYAGEGVITDLCLPDKSSLLPAKQQTPAR